MGSLSIWHWLLTFVILAIYAGIIGLIVTVMVLAIKALRKYLKQ